MCECVPLYTSPVSRPRVHHGESSGTATALNAPHVSADLADSLCLTPPPIAEASRFGEPASAEPFARAPCMHPSGCLMEDSTPAPRACQLRGMPGASGGCKGVAAAQTAPSPAWHGLGCSLSVVLEARDWQIVRRHHPRPCEWGGNQGPSRRRRRRPAGLVRRACGARGGACRQAWWAVSPDACAHAYASPTPRLARSPQRVRARRERSAHYACAT